MSKIKSLMKDNMTRTMLLSGLCKPISMLISFIYVPIVLNYLEVEKYGIWATILTIVSWISYFDIGIGNGLRNKLTESINRGDGKEKQLVSSAYAFITVIMIVITLLFSMCVFSVNWKRIFGVSNIDENLGLVVLISFVFVALNFVLSICKNVLYALQKSVYVSEMELVTQMVNLFGVLIVTRLFKSSLFVMAIVYGLSMTIVNLASSILVYANNKNLCPSLRSINVYVGKGLTNLGVQFFIIQICALVLFTTDSLIISYLYGAADVTPYNTVNKFFNVIIGVYTAMIAPIWSAVGKEKANKNYSRIKEIEHKVCVLMTPFVFATVVLAVIFKPLTGLWLGRDLDYTTELIIFGALYCLLSLWCNTYASIANGLELMKISIIVAVIQAAVNIPLSLFLAENMGMKSAGVLAGTVLSMAISAIIQPLAVKKELAKR